VKRKILSAGAAIMALGLAACSSAASSGSASSSSEIAGTGITLSTAQEIASAGTTPSTAFCGKKQITLGI